MYKNVSFTYNLPVISLSEVAVDTGVTGSHDDAAVFLLSEDLPCGLGGLESAFYMHSLD